MALQFSTLVNIAPGVVATNRGDGLTLAPIRAGVGARAGANVGYLKYTPSGKINPF